MHVALKTGEETSELKLLTTEELEQIYAKILWLQQHILSPGQAWRMFRWTPLEVQGH